MAPGATDGPAGRDQSPAPGEREEWTPEAVRGLRAHLDVSQGDLAERIGTRQQTISEWETGARRPRRMSSRLLRLVAEESGYYHAGDAAAEVPDGTPGERGEEHV